DILAFVDTANISGSFNATTGVLSLSGSDTLANYQAALRSVTYQNTSDNPNPLARTVSFVVNDGDVNSTAATSTITVTAVNDAPINIVPDIVISQLGTNIVGEFADDQSGYSVATSADGLRIAISAPFNNDNGNNAGHVRIYQWDGNDWIQMGADIDGSTANDQSGYSIAMSDDGLRIAIGAPFNDDSGNNAGHVRIY
ncbi:hypothetical protein, partial [Cysteiniphilum halobium]|uniref:hypothetical protein n=1 Tax=Cysteiniphilum halobium TaxID=2219059 RepID=UPI001AAD0DA1